MLQSRVCQKSTHFRCHDGKCISNNLRCDKKYDCDEEEDENNCVRIFLDTHTYL